MRRMFEERRSVWQRAPIQRKCPSLVLEGVGFFPSAQPSGFFFVGIGPASGAPHFLLSWPPPVGDSSTTTILLPRHPLVPPPLLQHHPLSPSRQWTVGPARGEKLNLVHERRGGNDWTVGERGCHQVVEIYIWKYHSYAKAKVTIEKRQSQKRARHAGGKARWTRWHFCHRDDDVHSIRCMLLETRCPRESRVKSFTKGSFVSWLKRV